MKKDLMKISTSEEPNIACAWQNVKETLLDTKHFVHRLLISVDTKIAYAIVSDIPNVPRIMR